jgi:hypothetical protein
MFGVTEEEKVKAQGRRLVIPYLVGVGALAVLCAVVVKVMLWLSSPPVPRQEDQHASAPVLSEEAISKDLPPYALPPGASETLRSAKSLEIYLIGIPPQPMGTPAEGTPKPAADEDFHGNLIFGSTRVTSPQAVKAIVESLIRGVEQDDDEPMGCFFPRHGVRASLSGGSVLDLVICYQCQLMEVYLTGQPVQVYTFADSRQPLNEALQAAGVDLKQEVPPFMPEP